MKKLKLLFLTFFLLSAPLKAEALVFPEKTDKVSVTVIPSLTQVPANAEFSILVRLDMFNGWHTYWLNPGDAGLTTKIKWEMPEGYQIEPDGQSGPEKFMFEDLVQYGYSQTAYFKFKVKAPKKLIGDREHFSVFASWLACREECVPGLLKIDFTLPVVKKHARINKDWKEELQNAERTFPQNIPAKAQFEVKKYKKLLINIENFRQEFHKILFIPTKPDLIVNSAEQKVGSKKDRISLEIHLENENFDELEGVFNVDGKNYNLKLTPAQNLTVYPAHDNINFEIIILMAFIGGLILNFMPCIFPILFIKALSLVQHIHKDNIAEGLLYFLGVVFSFLIIATILIFLRLKGDYIGWGFQLQSPVFVSIMIIIFLVIMLMFLDVINFNNALSNRLGSFVFKSHKLNAFCTGFFSVVIASPCTAPFMGVAIGYTLSKPIDIYYPVFLAISVGYALPFSLICFFPEIVHRTLPKPGRWMLTLKKIFAFPVFLTCLWLGWVLCNQIFHIELNGGKWQAYNKEQVNQLVAEDKRVFLNFTAKWCITCIINEKIALNSDTFDQLVKKKKIVLFKGDWTNEDKEITTALENYGRNSVPLYVYYDGKNRAYKILPQLLTEEIIKDAIK